jgi:tripartite-type tricarboxylate transporter receptor subunit TctC
MAQFCQAHQGLQVAQAAASALGQPVLVENKAGATGTLTAAQTAKSGPDGHTLLVSGPSMVRAERQRLTQIVKRLNLSAA